MPKQAAVAKEEKPAFRGVVGKQTVIKLSSVKPNGWNPNKMTAFEYESLKQGLKDDGWLASDAMLVWGKDESGGAQNLIINGEHRHRAALELGMKEGPAVTLNGIAAAEAKALTIKLDNKRGRFDEGELAALVRDIRPAFEDVDFGMMLGIDSDALVKMLAEGAPPIEEPLGSNGFEYEPKYGVIVMAENEAEQQAAFARLTGLGYKCRVVVV